MVEYIVIYNSFLFNNIHYIKLNKIETINLFKKVDLLIECTPPSEKIKGQIIANGAY